MNTIRSLEGGAGRWVELAGGCVMAVAGLRRGSWPGMLLVAAGAALAYRALAGNQAASECPMMGAYGCSLSEYKERVGAGVTGSIYDDVSQARKEEQTPAGTYIDDVVDEASDDSFPASDPPAWTAR